ncbi:MAG: TolC family protein, partial [Firmicutes bacterium]|nr:TolC family protein [Bacillota bacterium]
MALAMENNVRVKQAAQDKGAAYVAAEQARIARAQALDALEGKPVGQAPSYYVSLYTTEEQKAEAKKIADKAFEVVKEQVRLVVEKAYFDVLKNQELVRVNEAALERAKHQLELARAGFTAGTAPKTDVLAAEAGVASAEAQ